MNPLVRSSPNLKGWRGGVNSGVFPPYLFMFLCSLVETECPSYSESPQRAEAQQEGGRGNSWEVVQPPGHPLQVTRTLLAWCRGYHSKHLRKEKVHHWGSCKRFHSQFFNDTSRNGSLMFKKGICLCPAVHVLETFEKPFLKCFFFFFVKHCNHCVHQAFFSHSCGICKKNQDQHLLLLCDTCKLYYHLGCLEPPLTRMPKKTKNSYWWEGNVKCIYTNYSFVFGKYSNYNKYKTTFW